MREYELEWSNCTICVVSFILKDWVEEVGKIYEKYEKKDGGAQKQKELIDLFKDIYPRIFNVDSESEASLYESSQATGTMPERIGQGKFRRDFAKKYAKRIESDFGRNGSKLPSMSLKVSSLNYNVKCWKLAKFRVALIMTNT